jgi:hypothetical protein
VFRELGRKADCTDCAPLVNHRIGLIFAEQAVGDMLKGEEFPRRLR